MDQIGWPRPTEGDRAIHGVTYLHTAMGQNDVVATRVQLEDLYRPGVTDKNGSTPLHTACYKNSWRVIKPFIRDERTTPDVLNKKNNFGETALMVAVTLGHLQCVKKLASAKWLDWNTKNSDNMSLIEVARAEENDAMVSYLENADETTANHIAESAVRLGSELKEEIAKADAIKQNITSKEEEVERKRGDIENQRRALADQQQAIEEKKRQLLAIVGKGRQQALECSICMEEMMAPVQVYRCKNFHLICGTCKPSTTTCMTCNDREGYRFRSVSVEQMILSMKN